jgi:hypothetical protein
MQSWYSKKEDEAAMDSIMIFELHFFRIKIILFSIISIILDCLSLIRVVSDIIKVLFG